jgi:hypothetical protein
MADDKSNQMRQLHAHLDPVLRRITDIAAASVEELLAAMRAGGVDEWDRMDVGRRYAKTYVDCAEIVLLKSGRPSNIGDEFYDVGEIRRQRNELLGIIEGLIDAWRAGDDLDRLLADARLHVGEMLHYSENFNDIFTPRLKRDIDKWIDAMGTAPPGLHPSNLECWTEEPHPNPPGKRDPKPAA